MPSGYKIVFSESDDAKIRSLSIVAAVAATGYSRSVIIKRRKTLGVHESCREFSDADDAVIRSLQRTARDAIALLQCTYTEYMTRRDELGLPMPSQMRDGITPLLGTMPDPVLARKFGLTASAVCTRRRLLSIPVFTPARCYQCRCLINEADRSPIRKRCVECAFEHRRRVVVQKNTTKKQILTLLSQLSQIKESNE